MVQARGWPDRRGMGAQSDFISESLAPDERYKAQQRALSEALRRAGLNPAELASLVMDEDTVPLPITQRQPHLIENQGTTRCSVCKQPFPPGTAPSLDDAFAEHVLNAHRSGSTTDDAS